MCTLRRFCGSYRPVCRRRTEGSRLRGSERRSTMPPADPAAGLRHRGRNVQRWLPSRAHLGKRSLLVAAALIAVVLAAALAVLADPFGRSAASGSSGLDNGFPTSTQRVVRRSLSSQTQVSATLGY